MHLPNCSAGSAAAAAAAAAAAPTPGSEQSTGGTDRRGRQRITWQPPTSSQKDADAQVLRRTSLLPACGQRGVGGHIGTISMAQLSCMCI